MLKLSDLALRPDFQVGPMLVSPPRRLVEGPGGFVHVEPLIMQVFLLLLDSGGKVVTRNELFDQCWGGVYVGDDSLNRAIAKVRRIGAQVAPGLFEIETIPRTGYRLTGEILDRLGVSSSGAPSGKRRHFALSRREMAGGVAGLLGLAGIGTWATLNSIEQRRFDALMDQGAQALRYNDAFNPEAGRRALDQAVSIRPGSARAWGMLAFARSILAQDAAPKNTAKAVAAVQEAAQKALSINPREPNALLAMFEVEGSTLDWWTRDQRLRQIIAIDPANVIAIAELVLMLQAAGYSRESWDWNERALALEPLSSDFLGKRALKLWIAGRVSTSDKVIDQLRALYPTDPWAWFVRFLIFAMSGRAYAAQAMLDSNPKLVPDPVERGLWQAALPALLEPSAAAIAQARKVGFEAAKTTDQTRGEAVMILSALGDVDGAFEIANGYLLARGPIVRREEPGSEAPKQDASARINTQWMFTPPCARLRADTRFQPLCDGIGLTEYWHRRGMQPDFLQT
jgi:DNA-binding winged helix-turn-helix (wHTH) protein